MSLPSTFNTCAVEIGRTPVEVWALFQDRSRWMDAFVSSDVVEGAAQARGAVLRVVTRVNGEPAERREEVLHVEPARRWVVRLSADWATSGGHGDFLFEALDGGRACRLTVSIHGWFPDAPAEARAAAAAGTQAKIEADFARLKQVAEAGGEAGS